MAKKFDSEALLKQRFWILLGVLVPLVAAVMIVMWQSLPPKIKSKTDAINGAKGLIGAAAKSGPKNKNWLPLLDHRKDEALGKKNDIWLAAWNSQKDFLTEWPADMPENMKAKPIWSDFTEESREKYAADLYQPQLREIPKLPQPEGAREEVVQFKGGWEKIVDLASLNTQPESEEIWLAQEDIWIQKEMLRLIREANELAGTLKRVEPRTPEEKAADGTFANAVWRMSVKIESPPGKFVLNGKLTNESPWRQTLGLHFRIHFPAAAQGGFAPETVAVEGEPLLPGESCKFSGNLKLLPDRVEKVTQLFDWRTAPIKRIDALRIPARSSKNAAVPLRKNNTVSKAEEKTTASGLTRERYIEIQGPVRRFPFGIALVVEQQYLQDVLSAFANSRLRIVLTQVMWQHFRDVIHPPVKSAANASNDPLAGLRKKQKRTGGVGSSVARGARTAERDEPAPEAAAGPTALPEGPGGPAPEEQITDLLEVAIYGTATLYRPYDPKDKPSSPAAAPTTKK